MQDSFLVAQDHLEDLDLVDLTDVVAVDSAGKPSSSLFTKMSKKSFEQSSASSSASGSPRNTESDA
jgi:hypothetical protein